MHACISPLPPLPPLRSSSTSTTWTQEQTKARRPHHYTSIPERWTLSSSLIQSSDCIIAVSTSVAYQKRVELDDSERVFGEKTATSDAEFAAIGSAPCIALVHLSNCGVGSVHVFEKPSPNLSTDRWARAATRSLSIIASVGTLISTDDSAPPYCHPH